MICTQHKDPVGRHLKRSLDELSSSRFQVQLQLHLRVQVQVEFVCPKHFLSRGHDVRCACLPVLNQGKRFEIVLPFGRVEKERQRGR